jgi:hypothetical protein
LNNIQHSSMTNDKMTRSTKPETIIPPLAYALLSSLISTQ